MERLFLKVDERLTLSHMVVFHHLHAIIPETVYIKHRQHIRHSYSEYWLALTGSPMGGMFGGTRCPTSQRDSPTVLSAENNNYMTTPWFIERPHRFR